jgi:hypothetical protein
MAVALWSSPYVTTYMGLPFTQITFDTPPDLGDVITADYIVDGVHKTDQYVIDVSFAIQFGEGVWVGASPHMWLRIAKNRLVGWSDALTNTEKTNLFKAWLTSQFTAGTPVTVVYQLDTPTRTPLTFTLNNASTAPECPMEFLTDTPSLEYPAEVFDASGMVKVANADNTQSQTATTEILRSNADGTVCDEQNVTTGVVTRRMSEWANITGANTLTKADSTLLAYKVFKMSLGDLPIPATATTNITAQKYDSALLTAVNASPTSADRIYTDGSYFYLSAAMADTGFSEACLPSDDEIKAYFYGWKMCHSDGSTPYTSGTKHWKKLVGTEAEIQASITSTLPTASYEGFTPYKMSYELAEPIEEQHTPATLPTYYPSTVITTTNDTPAELTTTATVKVEDEE